MRSHISLLFFATALLLSVTLGIQAQDAAQWTFMQYFFLDNDLEPQIFGDVIEMTNVGSTDDVNLVAQIDRAQGYEGRYGDWTDTRRYLLPYVEQPILTLIDKQIEVAALILAPSLEEIDAVRDEVIDLYDTSPADVEELLTDDGIDPEDEETLDRVIRNYGLGRVFDLEPLETLGEVDMGTTEALVDFMLWSMTHFPAEKYALVISSHGAGWSGNGPDEDSDSSILTLPEIDAALAQVRHETGIDALELVGFDACLMGQIEVYATLAPHARYVLAAEETIPGEGWEYTAPFSALVENPDMDGATLGELIIDGYMDYYAGVGARTQVDLHLVDPALSGDVIDALTAFAEVTEPVLPDTLTDIGLARVNAQVFGGETEDVLTAISTVDMMSSVDLIHLMRLIAAQPETDTDVVSAAQDVVTAAEAMVIYSRADDALPEAHGVAVYFPINLETASLPSTDAPSLAYVDAAPALTRWAEFLTNWITTLSEELQPGALVIAITDVLPSSGVSSIYDPPVVLFDTDGLGIASITFSAILRLDDGTKIMLDNSPLAFEVILEDGEIITSYPTGLSENNQFTWNVEMPVISDGVTSIPALVEIPTGRAVKSGFVVGLLEPQDGDPTSISVIFDLETRAAIKVFATADNGAPFEIQPLPGDKFTPYWASYDADGEFEYVPANDTLSFDVVPFTFDYAPADSGTYELSLRIEDYAGNNQLSSAEIAVDNEGLDTTLRGFKEVEWGINFLFPWGWSDPTVIAGDPEVEGDEQIVVTDPDGEISIFVSARENTQIDLDDAIAETFALLESLDDAVMGEAEVYDALGYPAVFINYQYTLEGQARSGAYLLIDLVDTGYVYGIDFDAPTERAEEGLAILNTLLETLSFFEPVRLS